jgi:hypothetical protein
LVSWNTFGTRQITGEKKIHLSEQVLPKLQ